MRIQRRFVRRDNRGGRLIFWWLVVVLVGVVLQGCGWSFPTLAGPPQRPSEKSSWEESKETKLECQKVEDTVICGPKTYYAFKVGHEDSRPRQNVFARLMAWISSLGAVGLVFLFLPLGSASAIAIYFVQRAMAWRKALIQTVKGIKASKQVEENQKLYEALEASQDEDVKVFLKNLRAKV